MTMERAISLLALISLGLAPAADQAGIPGTTTARRIEHTAVEQVPGTVRAAAGATLMSRVQGVVARLHASPGQSVAAGAMLAELDALEIAAKRDQAKAAAAQAAADFTRIDQLFAKQAVTKAEFDAAQARAAGTAAAAAEAEVMVGYTVIRAPFAGVVVRKHAEVGDLLAPGRAVFEIEDPASLRLEIEVPESLAGRLALKAELPVEIPAAGWHRTAPVVEVTPAADPVSRTVLVKLALPGDLPGLRSGQFGRATVPVAAGTLLTVPATALIARGQLDAVFVVADGKALLRLVRLGGREDGQVAIRAGLADGEVVVTAPAGLRDGQPFPVR